MYEVHQYVEMLKTKYTIYAYRKVLWINIQKFCKNNRAVQPHKNSCIRVQTDGTVYIHRGIKATHVNILRLTLKHNCPNPGGVYDIGCSTIQYYYVDCIIRLYNMLELLTYLLYVYLIY